MIRLRLSAVLLGLLSLALRHTGASAADAPASPGAAADITVAEFDLAEAGHAFKYPACTLPGIYRVEPDRLTVCFRTGVGTFEPGDPNAGAQIEKLLAASQQ